MSTSCVRSGRRSAAPRGMSHPRSSTPSPEAAPSPWRHSGSAWRRTPPTSTPWPSSSTRLSSRFRRASPAAPRSSPAPTTTRAAGPARTAWPRTCAATGSGCARRPGDASATSTRGRSCPTGRRRPSSPGSGRGPSPAPTRPAALRRRSYGHGGWGRRRARRPTSSRRSSVTTSSTPSATIPSWRRRSRTMGPFPGAAERYAYLAVPPYRWITSRMRETMVSWGRRCALLSRKAGGVAFICRRTIL